MLDYLPILLAVIAVIVILIAGWYFMVAAPNTKKKTTGGKVKDPEAGVQPQGHRSSDGPGRYLLQRQRFR